MPQDTVMHHLISESEQFMWMLDKKLVAERTKSEEIHQCHEALLHRLKCIDFEQSAIKKRYTG